MRVRRLGWAGVEVEAGDGSALVIDLLEDVSPLASFVGPAHTPLPAPRRAGHLRAALVTHLHRDHADAPAIRRVLGPDGVVLRPARADGTALETAGVDGAEAELAGLGLDCRVLEPWQSESLGPFEVTAVPAADGLGDPQVSWVVAADGARIIHCGDTLFHGWWWRIAMRLAPFDAAFLPVNGAVVDLPHRQPPSPLPAALDPRQAAVAGLALRARAVVPIHYDTLHHPPAYAQVPEPEAAFVAAAAELGVPARVLAPGEELDLAVAGRA